MSGGFDSVLLHPKPSSGPCNYLKVVVEGVLF